MKTYKLIYEETIVYEKYVQDKEDKKFKLNERQVEFESKQLKLAF